MKDSIKKWIPFWGLNYMPRDTNMISEHVPTQMAMGCWNFIWIAILMAGGMLLFANKCSAQKIGTIQCSPFPMECLVAYNVTYQQLNDLLGEDTTYTSCLPEIEEYFDEGDAAFTTEINCGYGNVYYMVFLAELQDDRTSYNTIAHETIHLLQYLDEYYCVDFTKEIESNAYLFEYLNNQIYDIITQK